MSNENVGLMLSKFNCLCRNTLPRLSPLPSLLFVITLLPVFPSLWCKSTTTKPPTWRAPRVFVLSQQNCTARALSFRVYPPSFPPYSACHYPIHPNPLQAFSRSICIVWRCLPGEACAPDYDNCMKL